VGNQLVPVAALSSNSRFEDMHGQRIDDHTFGNHNSKPSLFDQDELFKITE